VNVAFACTWCDRTIPDGQVVHLNGAPYHRGLCAEAKIRASLTEATIPAPRADGEYTIADLFDNVRTSAQERAAEAVIDAARMAVSVVLGDARPELLALHHAVQALDALGALDSAR
jgi:hypothetical protein